MVAPGSSAFSVTVDGIGENDPRTARAGSLGNALALILYEMTVAPPGRLRAVGRRLRGDFRFVWIAGAAIPGARSGADRYGGARGQRDTDPGGGRDPDQ